MSTESEETHAYGIDSRLGWPLGSALGGALGAVAMGLVLWAADPEIVEVAIPSFYGVDPAGVVGWSIHVAHGVVLGLLFGLFVTREPILGVISTDAETEPLSRTGLAFRIVGAGIAYGLAVWAILPVIILPAVSGVVDGGTENFPMMAVQSLFGHLLFGAVVGIVFALTADTWGAPPESSLER